MSSYDDFGRRLLLLVRDPALFAAALPDIEQVIRTSIEENFRVGGRYGNDNPWGGGSQRWAPVDHEDPGKRILVDTADMLNSLDVRAEIFDGVVLFSVSVRPFYGRFHQDGTSRMPARPFMVIQDEDIETITEVLAAHLGSL